MWWRGLLRSPHLQELLRNAAGRTLLMCELTPATVDCRVYRIQMKAVAGLITAPRSPISTVARLASRDCLCPTSSILNRWASLLPAACLLPRQKVV